MIRALQVALLVLVIALTGAVGFACWGIYATVAMARDTLTALNENATAIADHAVMVLDQGMYSIDQVASEAVRTSSNLNRPCKGKAGPDACGVLAQLNKTVIKAGDAVVTTQVEERNAVEATVSASKAMSRAATSIAGTAQAATITLDELSDRETGITPTLGAYRDAGVSLNVLLKQKAITETFDNVDRLTAASAGTMENLEGITKDAKIETDAMVAPKTKKQKVLEFVPPTFKLGITLMCFISKTC